MQDINVSLFLVTVDRQNRDSRRRGERIPRYQKFLQVGVVTHACALSNSEVSTV